MLWAWGIIWNGIHGIIWNGALSGMGYGARGTVYCVTHGVWGITWNEENPSSGAIQNISSNLVKVAQFKIDPNSSKNSPWEVSEGPWRVSGRSLGTP